MRDCVAYVNLTGRERSLVELNRHLAELIEPGLRAARRVLGEMSNDDIPARLRKVAAHSGKRLPPPFADSLIHELDASDWLRNQVLDSWTEFDVAAEDMRLRAASLFLGRPDNWESMLDQIAAESGALTESQSISSLKAEITSLREALDVAKRKERAAREHLTTLKGEFEGHKKQVRNNAEEIRRREEAKWEGDVAHLERLKQDSSRLRRELNEADGKIRQLRELLLRERRLERVGDETDSPRQLGIDDPLRWAKMLDDMVAATRPAPATGEARPQQSPMLELPAGIRPDRSEAIRWLLVEPAPLTLVVDGYNVSFQLDEAGFSTPQLRSRIKQELARLQRLAMAPIRVILVFDTAEEPSTAPGPIEVRFAISADQEIVDISRSVGGRVVVVSTDRDVRERAERHGAVTLWSDALVAWIRGT